MRIIAHKGGKLDVRPHTEFQLKVFAASNALPWCMVVCLLALSLLCPKYAKGMRLGGQK
ncbi:hypothetical protein DVH05_012644 [Phytophthora capsici]|nr:hypothetical protein DVH05_012644 [Phytophthora capsici]